MKEAQNAAYSIPCAWYPDSTHPPAGIGPVYDPSDSLASTDDERDRSKSRAKEGARAQALAEAGRVCTSAFGSDASDSSSDESDA